MDNVFFENPPVLQGNERTQLQQIYGFLYNMSSKLNEAMLAAGVREGAATETDSAAARVAAEEEKKIREQSNTLKALIVKTADIVRTEMQEIATTLHGETVAVSEQVGTLQENLDAEVRVSAEGILQDYHFDQLVTDTATNTFFRQQTNQYIFTGKISDSPVEYGIAIGEGVTAYDNDGNPYLNQNAKVATFTMNKLAFWQGTTQLAYFSSGKFYITNGEITNTLQIGNYIFKKLADDSMVLVRV